MYSWPGAFALNHGIHLVSLRTASHQLLFTTINGLGLLKCVLIMKRKVTTTGTGSGKPVTATQATRVHTSSTSPAGDCRKMSIRYQFLRMAVSMGSTRRNVHRKPLIRKHRF